MTSKPPRKISVITGTSVFLFRGSCYSQLRVCRSSVDSLFIILFQSRLWQEGALGHAKSTETAKNGPTRSSHLQVPDVRGYVLMCSSYTCMHAERELSIP